MSGISLCLARRLVFVDGFFCSGIVVRSIKKMPMVSFRLQKKIAHDRRFVLGGFAFLLGEEYQKNMLLSFFNLKTSSCVFIDKFKEAGLV